MRRAGSARSALGQQGARVAGAERAGGSDRCSPAGRDEGRGFGSVDEGAGAGVRAWGSRRRRMKWYRQGLTGASAEALIEQARPQRKFLLGGRKALRAQGRRKFQVRAARQRG